jgi:hypothetical protein
MCLFSVGDNGDKRAVLTAFVELHNAVAKSVESVVLAHTDVAARVVDGTTLTDDNVTGDAGLSAEDFNAQTFAFGFTTVTGTTDTFFVSHNIYVLKG